MDGKGVAHAIGIDLGTTYSCVAVWKHDKVEIIPNNQGNRTTPSYVAFNEAGRLIGEAAMNRLPFNPNNTIYDAKRLIGRRFNDETVQEDMKSWPFEVIQGTNDMPKVVVAYKGERKEFFAEEISSMVLIKLKEFAEAYLGASVHDVVITVPAYFDDSQRQATKDAGIIAGLNVLQIINEPTSAAIAYALDTRTDKTRKICALIFDLGGGTFDVSIVTIDEKGTIKVKAVAGDTHIGGQDFDNAMVDHFVKQFNRTHKTDMSKNTKALCRLRAACEKAKRVLSTTTETTIDLDGLHQSIDFSTRISRAKFEHLNEDFFSKCIEMVGNCLNDAKLSKKDIDEVILVGGSTRIPKVRQLLTDFLEGKALSNRIHADEAVAYGAAVLAAKLSGQWCEKLKDLELVDVVPLSLGIRVHDGSLAVIIKRNSRIPAKKQRNFFTVKDDQSSILCNVYQGERTKATDNQWLGKFEVTVPRAPKGKSEITVIFDIDDNGILNCSAEESTTGLKKGIIISNDKQRLSKQEIEKMLKDAEKYKLQDEEYKKKAFMHNALEDYIYDVKSKIKNISNTGKTTIHQNDMEKMEIAIKEASQILDEKELADVDIYENALNQLEMVCVPIIAQLV